MQALLFVALQLATQTGTSTSALTTPEVGAASLSTSPGNDGRLALSVPLEVPGARGGSVTPKLTLQYTGEGTGHVGAGWDLALTYIEEKRTQRMVSRSDEVRFPDGFDAPSYVLHLGGAAIALVEEQPGIFRAEVEASYLALSPTSYGFEGKDAAGTRYEFRRTQRAENGSGVAWFLTLVEDASGNEAFFRYGGAFEGKPRLEEVNYNGFKNSVELFYDDVIGPKQKRAALGGLTEVDGRLSALYVLSHDEQSFSGGRPTVWRAYHLEYAQSPANHAPRLASIRTTGFGCEGECLDVEQALPLTTFRYADTLPRLGPEPVVVGSAAGPLPERMGYHPRDIGGGWDGPANYESLSTGDHDGDGRSDLFLIEYVGQYQVSLQVVPWVSDEEGAQLGEVREVQSATSRYPVKSQSNMIDLDGDGDRDLLFHHVFSDAWTAHLGPDLDETGVAWHFPQSARTELSTLPPCDEEGGVWTRRRLAQEIQDDLQNDIRGRFEAHARIVDVTGDGTVDLVIRNPGMPGWSVYPGFLFGENGGFSDEPHLFEFDGAVPLLGNTLAYQNSPSSPFGGELVETRTMLVDLNGDGLLDVIPEPLEYAGVVYLNTGARFITAEWQMDAELLELSSSAFAAVRTQVNEDEEIEMQTHGILDVNGDALPDALVVLPEGELRAYLGTGAGFGPTRVDLFGGENTDVIPFIRYTVRGEQRAGFAELTADNLVDYVSDTRGGTWTMYPNLVQQLDEGDARAPDRLVQIENGIGGAKQISYDVSTRQEDAVLPFVYEMVVAEHEVEQLPSESEALRPTTFAYAHAALHYDPARGRHRFRGFSERRSTTGGHGSLTRFHVDEDALAGRPELSHTFGWYGCFSETTSTTWALFDASRGSDPTAVRIPYAAVRERRIHEPALACDTQLGDMSGVIPERTRQERVDRIDVYGNPILLARLNRLQDPDDDVFVTLEYAEPLDEHGPHPIRNALYRSSLGSGSNGSITGTTRRFDGDPADPDDALPLGVVDKGWLKRIDASVNLVDDSSHPEWPRPERKKTYQYDSFGNVTHEHTWLDNLGRVETSTFIYDPTFHMFLRTEVRGAPDATQATIREYDFARGLVRSERTGTPARTRYFEYDAFHREASLDVTFEQSRVNVRSQTVAYDPNGITVTRVENLGEGRVKETVTTYDALGRKVRAVADLGADHGTVVEEQTAYTEYGDVLWTQAAHPETRTDPMTRYPTYDRDRRVVVVTTRPFMGAGLFPQTIGTRTQPEYDIFVERHAFVQTAQGLERTTFKDGIDPASPTQGGFAPSERVVLDDVEERVLQKVDFEGEQVDYDYDVIGNLRQVTRYASGNPVITRIDHDGLGRVVDRCDPDRGRRHFEYDNAGRVATVDIADVSSSCAQAPSWNYDQRVRFTRDALGRETLREEQTTTSPGPGAHWDTARAFELVYDTPLDGDLSRNTSGRLAAFIDPTGDVTELAYDEVGNTTRVRRTFAGLASSPRALTDTFEVERRFDVTGRLLELAYPDESNQIDLLLSYEYTSAGALQAIHATTSQGSEVAYEVLARDENGLATEVERGPYADIIEHRTFDPYSHQLTSLTAYGPDRAQAGPRLSLQNLTYDGAGRLLSMNDTRASDPAWFTFGYDDNGRLAAAEKSSSIAPNSWSFTYSYDDLGSLTARNALTPTLDDVSFALTPTLDRPHAVRSRQVSGGLDFQRYTHERGRVVLEERCLSTSNCWPAKLYDYDHAGRLLRFEEASTGEVHEYAYDALGNRSRVQDADPTGVERRSYDLGPWFRLVDDDQTDSLHVEQNIFGSRRVLATRSVSGGSELRQLSYLHDFLGSVRSVYDRSGNEVSRTDFLPFGELDATSSSTTSDFGFTGKRRDAGGLSFFGTRVYSPELLRFLSTDSIVPDPGRSDGFNSYAYVYNSPLSFVDDDGRNPALIAAAIIGAIAGGVVAGVTAYQAGLRGGELAGAILFGAVVGAIFGVLGDYSGSAVTALGTSVATTTWLTAPLGMAVSGAIQALGNAIITSTITGNWDALQFLKQVGMGFASGLLTGYAAGAAKTYGHLIEPSELSGKVLARDLARNAANSASQGAARAVRDGAVTTAALSGTWWVVSRALGWLFSAPVLPYVAQVLNAFHVVAFVSLSDETYPFLADTLLPFLQENETPAFQLDRTEKEFQGWFPGGH